MKTGVDYSPNHTFTKEKSPSFSMGYYAETNYSNNGPGPADYNSRIRTEQSFNRSENYFTTAKRPDSTQGKHTAAVGMYSIASEGLANHRNIRYTRCDEGSEVR